jgi:hypothetical protein
MKRQPKTERTRPRVPCGRVVFDPHYYADLPDAFTTHDLADQFHMVECHRPLATLDATRGDGQPYRLTSIAINDDSALAAIFSRMIAYESRRDLESAFLVGAPHLGDRHSIGVHWCTGRR